MFNKIHNVQSEKHKPSNNNIRNNNKSVNGVSEISQDFGNPSDELIKELSLTLAKQVASKINEERFASANAVLELVGIEAFIIAKATLPGLPKSLRPYFNPYTPDYPEPWHRFSIKRLKRTLERLEKRKLVEIYEEDGLKVVKITSEGKQKVIKFALDFLEIKKPKHWDGTWRLVSYDIPEKFSQLRKIVQEYLKVWGFYPLHESVYLHAYPCEKEVEFLRAYLGAGKYIRIFEVNKIENDNLFREYFNV